MKEIPLTQGQVAVVDDDIYEELMKYKWHAQKHRNTYYARRTVHEKGNNGKCRCVMLHHIVIGNPPLGMIVDHIDGNGLNNQRSNLRFVTCRQNQQNQHIAKTSQYPGVHWHKKINRWVSRIKVNGIRRNLGVYVNEKDAFEAYCKALDSINEVLINNII